MLKNISLISKSIIFSVFVFSFLLIDNYVAYASSVSDPCGHVLDVSGFDKEMQNLALCIEYGGNILHVYNYDNSALRGTLNFEYKEWNNDKWYNVTGFSGVSFFHQSKKNGDVYSYKYDSQIYFSIDYKYIDDLIVHYSAFEFTLPNGEVIEKSPTPLPSRVNESIPKNAPYIHISSPEYGAVFNNPSRDDWEPYSFDIKVKYRFVPTGWNTGKTMDEKILSGFIGYNPLDPEGNAGFSLTPISNKITRKPEDIFVSQGDFYWEGVATLKVTTRSKGEFYLGIVNKWFESIDQSEQFPDVFYSFKDYIQLTITTDETVEEGFDKPGDIDKTEPKEDLDGSGFPKLPDDAGIGDFFLWFFNVVTWLITFPLIKMYDAFTICSSYISNMVGVLTETSQAIIGLLTFIPNDLLTVVYGVLAFSISFSVVNFIVKLLRK